MYRRDFLKSIVAGAASLFVPRLVFGGSPKVVSFIDPATLFLQHTLLPGEAPTLEASLIPYGSKAYTITYGNRYIILQTEKGEAWVPCIDIGSVGSTRSEVETRIKLKAAEMMRCLMFAASLEGGHCMPQGDMTSVYSAMRRWAGHDDVSCVVHNNHLVGVDMRRRPGVFHKLVASEIETFDDPSYYRSHREVQYYGYTELGLAITNASVLCFGKLPEGQRP